jgi:hypothetical protein
MYNVLDIPEMIKAKHATRNRKKPIIGFHSTILLRPGTELDLIPPGSELRFAYGQWEAHLPIKNKEIVKKLAKALDAIAYM